MESSPRYLTTLFGDASAPVPAIISDIVSEIVELSGAAPHLVAAVALATVAAALGPQVALIRGRHLIPVSFNAVVSHDSPRTLPWFDAVTAPLLGRVFDMQAAVVKRGHEVRAEIDRNREDFDQAQKSISPNAELISLMKAGVDRAPASLKPFVATSGLAPKELCRLLPHSFDHGVVLVSAGNDPGADLLRLKTSDRADLTELLNRSWDRTPLSFGSTVYTGNISLLWQTRVSIRDLLGARGFAGFLGVPSLFLEDASGFKGVPEFAHEAEWRGLISSLLNHRCVAEESLFTLSPEADAVFTSFSAQIAADLAEVPRPLHPHIAWLPELAPRLATIFSILGGHEVVDEVAADAVEVVKSLGRQHVTAVAASASADAADTTDRKTVLLGKIRDKAPISRRDLRRSFEDQRVRWFDEALDALIEDKKVCYNDSGLLIPCQEHTPASMAV